MNTDASIDTARKFNLRKRHYIQMPHAADNANLHITSALSWKRRLVHVQNEGREEPDDLHKV